jgi:hypothetical protein
MHGSPVGTHRTEWQMAPGISGASERTGPQASVVCTYWTQDKTTHVDLQREQGRSRDTTHPTSALFRLPDNLKRYSKTLEYEYRVKTIVLSTLKRYSIISLTLYLE